MTTRDKRLLEQIVKQWAQDHTTEYQLADYENSEEAIVKTSSHFTWAVQEGYCRIDLLSLVERLGLFLESRRKRRHPDGMICNKCKSFYDFAEPNQEDGSMICYSCRNSC